MIRDEAFSWRMITYPSAEIIERTESDVHPPLYYLLLRCWALIGSFDIVWLRVLSVLAGMATVWLSYSFTVDLCRSSTWRNNSVHVGLLACTMVTIHPISVFASRSARMYSLGACFTLIASALFFQWVRGSHNRWFFLTYGLSVACCLYTHYYTAFVLAAHAVIAAYILLAQCKRERVPRYRPLFLSTLVGGFCFAPWLPSLGRQVNDVAHGYWIPDLTWQSFSTNMAEWLTGIAQLAFLDSVFINTTLVVMLAIGMQQIRRRSFPILMLLLCAAGPWVCCGVLSYFFRPTFQLRYMVFGHAFLLIGLSTLWLQRGPLGRLCLGLFFSFLALSWMFYERPLGTNPPPLAAVRQLRDCATPRDLVITNDAGTLNQLLYYSRREALPLRFAFVNDDKDNIGHCAHVASLEANDVVFDNTSLSGYTAVWQVFDEGQLAPRLPTRGFNAVEQTLFEGRDLSGLFVIRFEKRGMPAEGNFSITARLVSKKCSIQTPNEAKNPVFWPR